MTTSVFAQNSECSRLIPNDWKEPVPDAAAPELGETDLETFKNWQNFGIEQTAGKQTEFERAEAQRHIIETCEEMNREAIDDAKPKFLGIFG